MKTPLYTLEEGIPRLLGTQCRICHYRWFPAIYFGCERCGAYGDDLASCEFDGMGRLLSYVQVTQGEESFVLATIELQAGPVLWGIIEGSETACIGDRVEAYTKKEQGKEVVRFRRKNGEND